MAVNKTWFKNMDQLRQAVQDSDDLVVVEADRIMIPCGWERWTMNTGPAIVKTLRSNGFEVFGDVPSHRESLVRIFVPGSQVAKLVEAIRSPSLVGDEALREAARGDAGVLDQIRTLLGAPAAA